MTERARRLLRRVADGFCAIRARYGWFDHVVRAILRYDEVRGPRLAAAVTYYAFLALFPLLLLSFAVLGYLVGSDATVTARVSEFLAENLPTVDIHGISEARQTAGVLGLVGVIYAGLGWVETLRSSILDIWGKGEENGSFLLTKLVDVAVLAALAPITAVSIAISVVVNGASAWVLRHLGLASDPRLGIMAFVAGTLLNLVLFVTLLSGLPRLRMPVRRLFGPALVGSIGFELLKTFSQYFLRLPLANPAYAIVASAIGVLIFLNLLNQLLLFCAALTATSELGVVAERRALSSRFGRIRTRPARYVPAGGSGASAVPSAPP